MSLYVYCCDIAYYDVHLLIVAIHVCCGSNVYRHVIQIRHVFLVAQIYLLSFHISSLRLFYASLITYICIISSTTCMYLLKSFRCLLPPHTSRYTYRYIAISAYTYTSIYTYIHIYTHTYTYLYIYTYLYPIDLSTSLWPCPGR